MSRQSVARAHQKIQELSWEPQYHEPVAQYGTDYTFEKSQKKDPLKQVLRSYFPMQEEKDHRVYGAEDGAIRGNMFRQVQERWLEWQKLFLSIIPLPEISAARSMPMLFHTVPNPELHNGQAIQMIDEVRHSTIQQNLKRLYMNNYIDPAGFNTSLRGFHNDYCGTKDRRKDRESYAEMWRRWIYDDYYRSYLVPLEKYGLKVPHDLIEEAWDQIWNKGYVHEVAQFFATGWLANYWRIDPMTDEDFEWFEYKYPGWYDKYGKWWENYARLATPNGDRKSVV